MQTVADIMTAKVVSLREHDNLHQARMLLKEHNIRHLPVVSEDGRFLGILSQRDLLNNAFKVVEAYGFSKLDTREQRAEVKDFMDPNCQTMPSSASLVEAGAFFVANKHNCLPVVDDGQLQGIVTSVDFVKLSLHLLQKNQAAVKQC